MLASPSSPPKFGRARSASSVASSAAGGKGGKVGEVPAAVVAQGMALEVCTELLRQLWQLGAGSTWWGAELRVDELLVDVGAIEWAVRTALPPPPHPSPPMQSGASPPRTTEKLAALRPKVTMQRVCPIS